MTNITELLKNVTEFFVKNEDDDDHDDHDEHDHGDGDDNGVLIAKLTAMLVLFCASTFFGMLPYKLSKWFKWDGQNDTKSSIIIPLLLSFGGGVLLATTFLHLLPEISVNIQMLQSLGRLPEFTFHFAEFLMCMGFFAMYLVEEIVHTYLHHRVKSQAGQTTAEGAFQRALSIRSSAILKHSHKKENGNAIDSTVDLVSSDADLIGNGKIATISASAPQLPRHEDNHRFHHHHHNTHSHHQYTNGHSHSHLPAVVPEDDFIVSSIRGLLIVLALSVHELFEGLAVGLESSESLVWYMFGAVSAHKLVLAFCVGVELVVNKTRLWLTLIYVVTFAIVSPLGIGIGILLSNGDNADDSALPAVILQGIASGTLLYVVFFEILSKTGRSDLRQYATVLFGFLLMFGLQFATGHDHSHGGSTDEHDHNHEDEGKSLHNHHHHHHID